MSMGAQDGTVVLAGATGSLGTRIALALRARGAAVRAPVRPGTPDARLVRLRDAGVTVVPCAFTDAPGLAAVCGGAACVVSALNGLDDVMLGTQGALLDAAVAAGVPRFIPSDFSLDFTRTPPGGNRNLDLRRAFHLRLDRAPIRATSILNGAFADLLGGAMPVVVPRVGCVFFWGSERQRLDFTTMDDVAAFTAAAALDPAAPRILRIAGFSVDARGLADAAGDAWHRRFRTVRVGSVGLLAGLSRVTRRLAPGRGAVFPPWQGMQYMRDMFSGDGQLHGLDNDRYPGLRWTGVAEVLRRAAA